MRRHALRVRDRYATLASGALNFDAVAVESAARVLGARATARRHVEFVLQLFEAATTVAHLALDVTVRHTPADAHDHGRLPFAAGSH